MYRAETTKCVRGGVTHLCDDLHATEAHGHVHVDELVPEIPGRDP